jgi:hypothetical protein
MRARGFPRWSGSPRACSLRVVWGRNSWRPINVWRAELREKRERELRHLDGTTPVIRTTRERARARFLRRAARRGPDYAARVIERYERRTSAAVDWLSALLALLGFAALLAFLLEQCGGV